MARARRQRRVRTSASTSSRVGIADHAPSPDSDSAAAAAASSMQRANGSSLSSAAANAPWNTEPAPYASRTSDGNAGTLNDLVAVAADRAFFAERDHDRARAERDDLLERIGQLAARCELGGSALRCDQDVARRDQLARCHRAARRRRGSPARSARARRRPRAAGSSATWRRSRAPARRRPTRSHRTTPARRARPHSVRATRRRPPSSRSRTATCRPHATARRRCRRRGARCARAAPSRSAPWVPAARPRQPSLMAARSATAMPGAGAVASAATSAGGAALWGRFGASPEIATPIRPRPTTKGALTSSILTVRRATRKCWGDPRFWC